MSKIVKLTEADLTRIVRRVIQENEEGGEQSFDFSQIDKKLLSDFFTIKNNFEYVRTKDGVEVYVLKKKGFDVMVGVKQSEQPNDIILLIFVILPLGKRINYLEEVKGMSGIKTSINDYGKMTQLLQGAINFGRAQSDYDNLEPLPKF
jgi:hypothetical protein